MIKYILFDLDGTLLPMDQDRFFATYFHNLSTHVTISGYTPREIGKAVWESSREMVKNDGTKHNEEVFWEAFANICGKEVLDKKAEFDSFYIEKFDAVRIVTSPNKRINEIIKDLKSKGYTLAIATNPMFPRIATKKRIEWAGLDAADFEFYTTYEDSRHCKPNLDYYRDVMKMLGATAEECIMVGNDVAEDMIARKLGMKVFLITECLINTPGEDIQGYPNGTFDDLIEYLEKING